MVDEQEYKSSLYSISNSTNVIALLTTCNDVCLSKTGTGDIFIPRAHHLDKHVDGRTFRAAKTVADSMTPTKLTTSFAPSVVFVHNLPSSC